MRALASSLHQNAKFCPTLLFSGVAMLSQCTRGVTLGSGEALLMNMARS